MKKQLRAVCAAVVLSFGAQLLAAQEPQDVTMVQLICNPKKYHGKLIRVIGFLNLEFEGNVLYLHKEDYEASILGNGVWVEVSRGELKSKGKLKLRYVIIEGVFDSENKGHMGMWSGSIKSIRRLDPWITQEVLQKLTPKKQN